MKHLLLLTALLFSLNAYAHKPSDSYLRLNVVGVGIEGQWDIALRDLDFAIGLDANGDAQITWGEVRAKYTDIDAYATSRLQLGSETSECPITVIDHLIDDHTDGTYAILIFTAQCPTPPAVLEANYSLFSDIDPQHKGLMRLQYQGESITAIFTPETAKQLFQLGKQSKLQQFIAYCSEGIWHIWIGFDHILFLLALLLPAALVRHKGSWHAIPAFKPAFVQVFKIVTAFTIAHSITLSLSTLGILSLPSRWVESVIAASVVVAAFNNIIPFFGERRWAMAFGFGLIHGFGFASVLGDLGLPQNAKLLALLGFNIGVELGQLAIVAAFFPFAFFLRETIFYRQLVLFGGSSAIVLVALVWFLERAFNLKLLPF